MIDKNKFLNYLYFDKLPKIYRDMDNAIKTKPLYRYLQSLVEGGFNDVMIDINNLLDLINPEKCPSEFLPYLCRSFGIEYFDDIEEIYQRKFLANIGEILKRRGTYNCIRYIVRVLTDMECSFKYKRTGDIKRELTITLHAKTVEQVLNIKTNTKIIERYVNLYLPYYITNIANAEVFNDIFKKVKYVKGFIQQLNTYPLLEPRIK